MSAVVEAVGDFLQAVVAVVLVVAFPITLALAYISDDFRDFISGGLEIALGVFGIKSEDIVNVQVNSRLLFSEDINIQAMLTQLALTHAKTDTGIITLLMKATNNIRSSYSNYFSAGERSTTGLPDTNLRAVKMPIEAIKQEIMKEFGFSGISIIKADTKLPTKYDTVYYRFHKDYEYSVSSNEMVVDDENRYIDTIDENTLSNAYDVVTYIRIIKVTTTTVSVSKVYTEIEVPEDPPEGYIPPEPEYIADLVTTTVRVDFLTGRGLESCSSNSSERQVSKGSVSPSSNTQEEVIDSKVFKVTSTTVSVSPHYTEVGEEPPIMTHTGDMVTTTTNMAFQIDESTQACYTNISESIVPIGSVSPSSKSTSESVDDYDRLVISVPMAALVKHYIIRYVEQGSSEIRYWNYEVGIEGAEELDIGDNYVTSLEMLPVIPIRTNSISVNADKESVAYKEAKEILNTISIDVDTIVTGIEANEQIADIRSAYIHFGIDPSLQDKTSAKALYFMFNYIYEDTVLVSGNTSSYLVTLTEGDYNATLAWKDFVRTTKTGVAAKVNEYSSTVELRNFEPSFNDDVLVPSSEKTALVLCKQISSTQYIEYQISNLSTTTLIKHNEFADASMDILNRSQEGDSNIVIPLSRHFIEQLTPIEQMELFSKSLRMSIYALNVTHLEYYQTRGFAEFIEVLMYVAAVVIFVFTWYTGGFTSTAFITAVLGLLIGMAAAYAFKLLLESTDNPLLKAIYAVLYIAVMIYTGTFDASNLGITLANQIVFSISAFVDVANSILEDKYDALDNDREEMLDVSRKANKELNDAISVEADYLSTWDVQKIATIPLIDPFLDSVDTMIYRAGPGIQQDAIRLTVTDYYKYKFDYEAFYEVGVV